MKKVALYIRISTQEQRIDSQDKALLDYCQAREMEVVKKYVDVGISGTKDNRPQLNQLMADAKQGHFEAVLCFRFDRFARSTKHLLSALEEFRALKIDFISVSEAIDTSTALGEALFTIVAAISRLERDILVQRVKAGLATAKARGKTLGRPAKPIDPKIVELKQRGFSIRAIAQQLGLSKSAIHKALVHQNANLSVLKACPL